MYEVVRLQLAVQQRWHSEQQRPLDRTSTLKQGVKLQGQSSFSWLSVSHIGLPEPTSRSPLSDIFHCANFVLQMLTPRNVGDFIFDRLCTTVTL